jgi:predicted Zn-dependent protease
MWRVHQEAYAELESAEPPFLPARVAVAFRIGELKEHGRAEGYEGVVGRRLLQTLATNAGYYLSQDLMSRGDPARAALALSVAIEASPGTPYLWYNLACARARSGSRSSALDALEEALALGFGNRELMVSDEDLESLRDEPRFRALAGSPGTPP